MAKIYFDTEFLEDGVTIMPISIGMVRGDGKEYYAEFLECDWLRVYDNEWLMENVYPSLSMTKTTLKDTETIKQDILEFVGPNPIFWAYYCSYDWVLLCQLYGKMVDLPTGWPKFCNDLRQAAGKISLPKQVSVKHNALEDARWVKTTKAWLDEIQ